VRPALAFAAAVLAVTAADACGGLAMAQGRLEAQYAVTLGGVPFGKGAWLIDVRDDQFSASVNGATSGIVRWFTKGQGMTTARGTVTAGQPAATIYASSIRTDKRYDDVRMTMGGGNIKDFVAEPPSAPSPDRVPLTEAHRRGVSDPMTAAMMRVPGNGDTFVPEACQRTLLIFDGRMRYDLQLSFKRLDKVRSENGYQGTVVVCGVHFAPVAGHIPYRPVIKYLIDLRDTELWLAPIAGTRLMVPYRVSVTTPLGQGILQATQFNSMPYPRRTTATTNKPNETQSTTLTDDNRRESPTTPGAT
jgi:hypothetical protein